MLSNTENEKVKSLLFVRTDWLSKSLSSSNKIKLFYINNNSFYYFNLDIIPSLISLLLLLILSSSLLTDTDWLSKLSSSNIII